MLCSFCDSMLADAAVMFAEAFSGEPYFFDFLTAEKAADYLEDLTKTPKFVGFCFMKDSEPAAYCFGVISDYFMAPYYDIREIYVKTEKQGLGIGSEFLLEIENALASDGITAVMLSASRMLPAYRFYSKNGYAESKDNVHMFKMLR